MPPCRLPPELSPSLLCLEARFVETSIKTRRGLQSLRKGNASTSLGDSPLLSICSQRDYTFFLVVILEDSINETTMDC